MIARAIRSDASLVPLEKLELKEITIAPRMDETRRIMIIDQDYIYR
ncbi:MAG: hypothetical protein ONB13_02510 [candidate division KSB1 bacterium]|nr:hypothetical protein [candidate division KSB1 bacterium]MDZ7334726.1 hypothetical protein [candidate division KSB1 bacterium]MDZ7358256.1 hypothetical protein [candidate division KSB1 bacterium]MDZ7375470.1 hypothetical protein [candidate division KSB1 bacterium]MDZ7400373.1 hypothetical protein [candidate division KSB1 bacterium]